MDLFKKLQKIFTLQINTGDMDPAIPTLLAGYEYQGLSQSDDKTCLELAKTYFNYSSTKYVNCFRLFTQDEELVLIDKKTAGDTRDFQSNAIFLLGVDVKHDFEFTDDGSNLFNPETRKISNHEKLKIYFDSKEDFMRLEPHFAGVIDHYERFHDTCAPMSYFSHPQMKLLGYHLNGGVFGKEELDHIIRVMIEMKRARIDL